MHKKNKCQVLAVSSAFPDHYVEQDSITNVLKDKWCVSSSKERLINKLHKSVKVNKRHLSMPVENYVDGLSFKERNDIYIETAVRLGTRAINDVLDKTHIDPKSISQIIFTTVTGLAVPSIDARIINTLPFSNNIKRVPLFGLGCVAGAAGISRAADYLLGNESDYVILLSIELCSLTFQRSDQSIANSVGSGLFADGAAAVLLAGNNHKDNSQHIPHVVDNRSYFFKDTERVMGWDINNDGFKIVLSADVPKIALENMPECIDSLLKDHYLHRNDIATWICHPGGPKVIDALIKGLGLKEDALYDSYETLFDYGNLSSASVLLLLAKNLKKKFRPGDYGVLIAMGPGFCAEVVLLRW